MINDFDEFWKAYPKKLAKAEARKAWGQTKSVRPDLTKLLSSIEAACKTEQWARNGGMFIPHASTWLRGERWDDVYEVKLPDIVNEKPWYESATGIELKGKELGIDPFAYKTFPEFKAAVMRAAIKVA